MLIVLATMLLVGRRTTPAQNSPITLSLSRADWVSADAFSTLNSIRVLSNGMVLAVDGREIEVQLLDAAGKTVRQIGRKGSGPSEYTMPTVLIALPNDSTLLIDRDARRFLIIDPRGQITKTEPIAPALSAFADVMIGADPAGRLLFGRKLTGGPEFASAAQPIGRWTRGTDSFETVTMFQAEDPTPRPVDLKTPGYKSFFGQSREVFAAVDDWVPAPSGRIAILHAIPYRVDWVETNGKTTTGTAVTVTRVPVSELDKKQYEPQGPPYKRNYAKVKSPFMIEFAVVDDQDNVWVPRWEAAGAKQRRWDVFSATGTLRGTALLPIERRLMTITAQHAYVRYIDSDGLQWIERYAR